VWGPRSYDDASGLARVYTLAGFVRHAMPWDKPGEITDHDAQEIAAFVDGQPRPASGDIGAWDGTVPVDAVYDRKQYPKNPFYLPLDP
jgi:cytochrome c